MENCTEEGLYKREEISIKDLFDLKFTDEKSMKALRGRVNDNVLVYVDTAADGRTRLYDKQLSSIRAKAARRLKRTNPQVTWGTFKRVFERLDKKKPSLNQKTIKSLENGTSDEEAVKYVVNVIVDRFHQDGHENFTTP